MAFLPAVGWLVGWLPTRQSQVSKHNKPSPFGNHNHYFKAIGGRKGDWCIVVDVDYLVGQRMHVERTSSLRLTGSNTELYAPRGS